jgi:hypothetical protein
VAFNFSTSEGIVLQLCRYGLDVCFFDCSWVSYYANESEWLFIGGYQSLMIRNIILGTAQNRRNLRFYLKSMNTLQSMIEARANQEPRMKKKKKKGKKRNKVDRVIELLNELIQYKFDKDDGAIAISNNNNNNNNNEVIEEDDNVNDNYIHRLFYYICSQWTNEIMINMTQMMSEDHYLHIRHLFFGFVDDNNSNVNNNNNNELEYQPKFGLFFKLFNKCPKFIFSGDVQFENGVQLNQQMMDELLFLFTESHHENTHRLFVSQLEFRAPNTSVIDIQQIAQQTQYFTGADLKMLFSVAHVNAFHRVCDQLEAREN